MHCRYFMTQSDGTNEKFTKRQYLAVGERKVCQQAIPYAGYYVNYRILFDILSQFLIL